MNKWEAEHRAGIVAALRKPLPPDADHMGVIGHDDQNIYFDPWEDIVKGIHGHYSSASDEIVLAAMKAVQNKKPFEFIDQHGFAGEFVLYVLSGHNLLEYGSSPRGGWPAPHVSDLWQEIIEKWEAYCAVVWAD